MSDELPAIAIGRVANGPEIVGARVAQRRWHVLVAGEHVIDREVDDVVDLNVDF